MKVYASKVRSELIRASVDQNKLSLAKLVGPGRNYEVAHRR